MTTGDAAQRCIDDPTFAQEVLDGDDHPEVRHALLLDIQQGSDVLGFFNPCPEPPPQGMPQPTTDPVELPTDIKNQWSRMEFLQLRALVARR